MKDIEKIIADLQAMVEEDKENSSEEGKEADHE